jgi:hypothetical protein
VILLPIVSEGNFFNTSHDLLSTNQPMPQRIPNHMRFIILLCLVAALVLHAQEPSIETAVLIDPIALEAASETPAVPQQGLEVPPENILESKVVYREGQKFTIQEIVPIDLPPIPAAPAPKPLTAEELAARDARIAQADPQRTLMLFCTVYDGTRTLITWNSQGVTPMQTYKAWSNVNFHHFDSLRRFKKNRTTYMLMFIVGDEDTARAAARAARAGKTYSPPLIPELPADSATSPGFQVIQGNPSAEELAPLFGLHEIYRENHSELIAEHQRLTLERAQKAAERLANPPDSKPDIIIQHWTIDPSAHPPISIEGGVNK